MKIRLVNAAVTIVTVCAMTLAGGVSASPTVGPVYDAHPTELVGLTIDLVDNRSRRSDGGLVLAWGSRFEELQKPGPMWDLNEPELEIVHRLRRVASEQVQGYSGARIESALAP